MYFLQRLARMSTQPKLALHALTASEAPRYLIKRGLIDPEAVIDCDLQVRIAPSRNCAFMVERGNGTGYMLKHSWQPSELDGVAHEAAVYQWLAQVHRDFNRHMPEFYFYDAEGCVLILQLVPDSLGFWAYQDQNGVSRTLAGQAGQILGSLHSIPMIEEGPEAHNWPDLRGARSQGEIARPVAFGVSWCHGAPGIALSRLRAYRLVVDEKCRDEANIALETTHKIVAAALHSRTGNYSLCHGLSGNAEVLMYGSDVLGAQWTHCRTLVLETAKVGMETYGSSPQAWRCGTPAGETPSLLLGLAGIGLFYLRLYDSTIPSILILEPEAFGKATRSNMAKVRSI
jgi:hypothetical protein